MPQNVTGEGRRIAPRKKRGQNGVGGLYGVKGLVFVVALWLCVNVKRAISDCLDPD